MGVQVWVDLETAKKSTHMCPCIRTYPNTHMCICAAAGDMQGVVEEEVAAAARPGITTPPKKPAVGGDTHGPTVAVDPQEPAVAIDHVVHPPG